MIPIYLAVIFTLEARTSHYIWRYFLSRSGSPLDDKKYNSLWHFYMALTMVAVVVSLASYSDAFFLTLLVGGLLRVIIVTSLRNLWRGRSLWLRSNENSFDVIVKKYIGEKLFFCVSFVSLIITLYFFYV